MQKRIFLYGGVILWTLALFIVLSDRHVTERVTVLQSVFVRFVVILAINLTVGSLVRGLVVRRRASRAT